MQYKDVKIDFDINLEKWEVEAYASAFGNVDSMKEVVDKGAFTKTIKERFPKNLIKVFWRHRDPFGVCKHIEEDSTGLLTVSKISKTTAGRDNMILIQDKAVDRMSIGYDVVKREVDEENDSIMHLKELRLYEYSPVPIAANEETSILDIKSPFDVYNLLRAFEQEYLYLGKGTDDLTELQKPYPNQHACRLRDPNDFQKGSIRTTFRKHNGKEYSVLMGRLKGETTMTEQAYRYDKDIWTASSAKTHCSDHDGKFEAAAKEIEKEGRILSTSNRKRIVDAIVVLQDLLNLSEPAKEKEIRILAEMLSQMKGYGIN